MTIRTTHTYAELEVSAAAYDEIAAKLRAASYDHAFHDGTIDMQGIGLTREGNTVEKNTLSELRNRLFEMLEEMKSKDSGPAIGRADAMVKLSDAITRTAEVEIKYGQATGRIDSLSI
jgi:hypothetical protein